VQVDPIKPKLKPPGTKRLKLNCDILLSTCALKSNMRHYSKVERSWEGIAGRGFLIPNSAQLELIRPPFDPD